MKNILGIIFLIPIIIFGITVTIIGIVMMIEDLKKKDLVSAITTIIVFVLLTLTIVGSYLLVLK